MQRHERDDRVFCTMKPPGKIMSGRDDFLSDMIRENNPERFGPEG
jgi:hypothetical protein